MSGSKRAAADSSTVLCGASPDEGDTSGLRNELAQLRRGHPSDKRLTSPEGCSPGKRGVGSPNCPERTEPRR
jgi:hypothetical protein